MDDERWTKLFWEAAKMGAKRGVVKSWKIFKHSDLVIVAIISFLVGYFWLYP